MNAPVVACPTCGKAVRFHPNAPSRPFCSERCRLGEWISEEKRIPGDPAFVENEAAFSADSKGG